MRIGIDVGGTGIQVGLVNDRYEILAESSIPTRVDLPFPEQVCQIAGCVKDTIHAAGCTEDDVSSVGIGIPGIAAKTGEIINCTNMGWHHVFFQ